MGIPPSTRCGCMEGARATAGWRRHGRPGSASSKAAVKVHRPGWHSCAYAPSSGQWVRKQLSISLQLRQQPKR